MMTFLQKYSTSAISKLISRSFRKYLSNIMEKDETRELHKTAIFDTANIRKKN
jgi:hypothetical protein